MQTITKELKNEILKVVNSSDYNKGKIFPSYYIDYRGFFIKNENTYFNFEVESQSSYREYDVDIIKQKDGTIKGTCACPQYRNFASCKHIAACLFRYAEQIIDFNLDKIARKKSLEILNSFKEETSELPALGTVKEELTLDVIIEILYNEDLEIKFKIGKKNLYMLKPKTGSFLQAYKTKQDTVTFGKNFTYDPKTQYFNKEDSTIIDYLYNYINNRYNPYYANGYSLILESDQAKSFLPLLKNKTFSVIGYGTVYGIKEETPFQPIISKKETDYIFDLNLNSDKFGALTDDFEYVIKDSVCYHVNRRYSELIEKMIHIGLTTLTFEEKDLPIFSKRIVPIVKEEIIVDQTVDNLVIVKKPFCKLYFDIFHSDIICNLKLVYGDFEIDYFEQNATVVRDNYYENEVVKDILELGFIIENNKFMLNDLEKIGEFFDYNLEEIAKKYDTYTSEKIKNTNVVKNSPITSTFSIGSDNIMSFSFDLGDITGKELDSIFDNLKKKKKYFKLKSGNILNLENNENLKQLEELADDLNLSNKDLVAGNGIIPKYRALYLDSLKKEKYHIIETDNLFDQFIDNFRNYKNSKLKLTNKEKEILRDYQVTGVEWLYNIYKCDLGGILADEMGLGKSIQVIYFFKKILQEDKKAKFLIVSPTSLVYNWKEEFDKFAPSIKYEILSNGKNQRHEKLANFNSSVYITSYGLVREDLEYYKEKNFTICVIDEAQNIKNPIAGITKAVKGINAKTKIALTGTPIENSVVELWSIFDYVMPGFFSNQKDFQSKYRIKEFDEDTNQLLMRLNKQIEPFILRRKKQDVLKELPEKIENNIYIDLSKEQKKLYAAEVKRVKEEMDHLIQTEGFTKARFMILQLLTKLRQLCIDPRIIFDDYKGESTKIENLLKIIQELIDNGHKILLFSSFRSAIDLVGEELQKNKISYYEINGSINSKKRMELVTQFNQDDTNVFLITLKAGGTGLNLTSADTVIHLDLWWNPQAENQATDRAHRIGQKNKVSVIKLVARGTIEEKILELQQKKKMLSDKIIEGDNRNKNMINELTEKDLQNLLSYEQEENN